MALGQSVFLALRTGAAVALQRALSAAVWFVLLAFAGSALIVCGVFVLAGPGAAMVSAGILCVITAALLLIGMTRGG